MLPVDDHGLHQRSARDVEIEDRVVTRLRVQNPGDDARIDRDGNGVLARAVNDGGNLAGNADAAGLHSC